MPSIFIRHLSLCSNSKPSFIHTHTPLNSVAQSIVKENQLPVLHCFLCFKKLMNAGQPVNTEVLQQFQTKAVVELGTEGTSAVDRVWLPHFAHDIAAKISLACPCLVRHYTEINEKPVDISQVSSSPRSHLPMGFLTLTQLQTPNAQYVPIPLTKLSKLG